MKTNLVYNWRITLEAGKHSITAHKFCTYEQALLAADELETEVEWLVIRVCISRFIEPVAVSPVRRIKLGAALL